MISINTRLKRMVCFFFIGLISITAQAQFTVQNGVGIGGSNEETDDGQYSMQTISSGSNWQIIRITDRLVRTNKFNVINVYVVQGIQGINNSPMHPDEKNHLIQRINSESINSFSINDELKNEKGRIFIVHKEISDAYRATGIIPEVYRTMASATCEAWTSEEIAETVTPTLPPFSGSQSLNDAGASITGDMSLSFRFNSQFDLGVKYNIGWTNLATFCVPYTVEVDYFSFGANLGIVDGQFSTTITSTHEFTKTFSREIANPVLLPLSFLVGPIPVRINFKLPTSIGIDLSASAEGTTSLNAPFTGSYNLDYECTTGGCSGSAESDFNIGEITTPTALQIDLTAKPWFDSRIRANLYSDSILYGEAGLRLGIMNHLWGFAGTNCGDSDGDGSPDLVTGAYYDMYFDLDLPYGYGGLLGNDEKFNDLWKRSIYFHDFINNTLPYNAMAPTVTGPQQAHTGDPLSYEVTLRSCYPLTETVTVHLEDESGNQSARFNIEPASDGNHPTVDIPWVFTEGGSRTLKVINEKDACSRQIGSFDTLQVEVEADPPVVYPPIEFTAIEPSDPPSDLRNTWVLVDWKLGWGLDPAQHPGITEVDALVTLHEFLEGDEIPAVNDVNSYAIPLEDLINQQVQLDDILTNYYASRIVKVCIEIDPDSQRELAPYYLGNQICIEASDEAPPLQELTATLDDPPNAIDLAWMDVTPNEPDNWIIQRQIGNSGFQPLVSGLTELQHRDPNLSPGTYQYRIRNHPIDITWHHSNVVVIDGQPPLPFNLAASQNDTSIQGKIRVTWNPEIIGAIELEATRVATGTSRIINITGVNEFLDQVNHTNEPYEYKIRRVGDAEFVDPAIGIAAPEANYNLTASDNDQSRPGKILVTWDDVGLPYYMLSRINQSTGAQSYVTVANGTSYEDDSVTPGIYYDYAVRDSSSSPWQTPDTGVAADYPPLGESTWISASDDELDQVRVEWATISGAETYMLYRTTTTATPTSSDQIGALPNNVLVYYDTNAPVDTDLYYWVRAANPNMLGQFGVYDHGYRAAIISMPSDLTATVDDPAYEGIRLEWTSVGMHPYVIERSESSNGPYDVVMEGNNRSPWLDTDAVPGTDYYYRVGIQGQPINPYFAHGRRYDESTQPPETSSWINVEFQIGRFNTPQVAVQWDHLDRAEGYRVYRALGSPNASRELVYEIPRNNRPTHTWLDFPDTEGTYYYWVIGYNNVGDGAFGVYSSAYYTPN